MSRKNTEQKGEASVMVCLQLEQLQNLTLRNLVERLYSDVVSFTHFKNTSGPVSDIWL